MSSHDNCGEKVLEAQENVDAARKEVEAARKKLDDANENLLSAQIALVNVDDSEREKHVQLVELYQKRVDTYKENLQGWEKGLQECKESLEMWVKERDRRSANTQQSNGASRTPSSVNSTSQSGGLSYLCNLVKNFIAPSIKISINGTDITTINCKRDNIDNICADVMRFEVPHTVESDNIEATEFATSLIEKLQDSEFAGQKILCEWAPKLDAMDTSTRSIGQFKDSKTHHEGVRFNLTAKCDLVFNFCPGVHEIKKGGDSGQLVKDDYEVLTQALLRVYTVRNCHAYYNTAWATACTGTSAWFVLFERDIEMFDGKNNAGYECITVRRINHDMIYKIWMSYRRKSVQHPNWFYTDHAPYLLRSISCICDPHKTITRLVAKSMACVYSVSLPRKDGEGIYASPIPDIAIKVMVDDDEYFHEKAALRAIVPAYYNFNLEFKREGDEDFHYALGYFDEKKNEGELTEGMDSLTVNANADILVSTYLLDQCEHAKVFLDNLKNEQQRFRRFVRRRDVHCDEIRQRSISGGTTIMRWGHAIHDVAMEEILAGVFKSLRIVHGAGWCHCDVRKSNVMIFNGFVQLIDFGMARKLRKIKNKKKNMSILQNGARLKSSGWFMKRFHNCGDSVRWTAADDYEMFHETTHALSLTRQYGER